MRQLIELTVKDVLEILFDDDKENVEFIFDVDMGYWCADTDPELTIESISTILKELNDNELLELYDYLMSV